MPEGAKDLSAAWLVASHPIPRRGLMLVISAVVLLIIYAMFMAMHLASPLVGRNFAGLF